MIAFIYMAVTGSLMVSYAKARAEGLGIECKTGLLARPERVILLAIGLLTNTGIWALALLAVLSNITAIQRIFVVWHNTQHLRQTSTVRITDQSQQQEHDASINNCHSPTTFPSENMNSSDIRPVPTSVPPFDGGAQPE
jgi:CDP-diacylglycerol--glycerol-3-phosphate 3-phosphatidyltransferase